ncbi:uncharacterized protein LOC122806697 isoform X2 [Protopterus annectens]|uniref:uncharacterized protein LOC122806697 isoform X2 n=1 Tax=Protopterus annectens TaxID=7888 RepID=UPI001CFAF44B|nr:uncharacterized protein LOC122806697 isoform X2 [Protopterus annectens]
MNSVTNKDHKKRLKQFTDEMMLLGSLQGFRYFQPWLRGKEELLLTVVNEDAVWQSHYPLPAPNVLSVQCQDQNLRLSPSREEMAGNMEDMVPPASPYEREISMPGTNCTLFLLAVYAKYQHPYVWIRSSHERFVNVNKNDALAHDSPLKLKSISEWNVKSIHIWNVVAELVQLCTIPPPLNPLALDMKYFESLPLTERLLSSGAVAKFLQRLVTDTSSIDKDYYHLALEDLSAITKFHFQTLRDIWLHKAQQNTEISDEEKPDELSL